MPNPVLAHDDRHAVALEAGAYLYRAGDAARDLFLIEDGEIELLKKTGGVERRWATLRAGDVLGEVGTLEGTPHEAGARALTPCTLVKIDPATLLGLVRQRPEIAAHIIRRLGRRLSAALDAALAPAAADRPAESLAHGVEPPADRTTPPSAPAAPGAWPDSPTRKRDGKEATAVVALAARLVQDRAGEPATTYPLARTTTIGRTLRNSIVIPSPDVSRAHARIDLTSGGFVLADLNSQNGTFVNGDRVKEHVLKDNDQVRIGDEATFVFRLGSGDEDQGSE